MMEDGSRTEHPVQLTERLVGFWGPIKLGLEDVSHEWGNDLIPVLNEPSIKISKSQKPLQLLSIRSNWPVFNGLDLLWICVVTSSTENKTEKRD